MILEAETIAIDTVEQVQETIRTAPGPLLPRGGSTKPALSTPPANSPATPLELSGLSGILEYQPSEFTFTARAGTPLAEIESALAEHGQYLPFDPPLVRTGATLGGTIAAGLSGARRYRYGGLRDFLIGVRFVDGQGQLVRGGGKVVKNAAGFDLPKLLTGSLGRLGVLVEASFKVFPNQPAFATLQLPCPSLAAAQAALQTLSSAPIDIEALDVTTGDAITVWVRIGGIAAVLSERMARVQALLGGGALLEDDAEFWQQAREFAWAPANWTLVKLSTNPHHLAMLDAALRGMESRIRYSCGGHLAWLAWAGNPAELDGLLARLGIAGVALRGSSISPLLGARPDASVIARVTSVLDPARRFLPMTLEP